MLRQNKRIHKENVYQEMKDLGRQGELNKLLLTVQARMKNISNLKQKALQAQSKNIIIAANQYRAAYEQFQKNIAELNAFTATSSVDHQRVLSAKQSIEKFIKQLKPKQIEKKVLEYQDDFLEKSGNKQFILEQKQSQIQKSRNALFDKKLQQDKRFYIEVRKAIQGLNQMATDAKNLLYKQGTQIEVTVQMLERGGKNMVQAKQNLLSAKDYVQDFNKKTIYICVFVTLVVLILLMIVYASRKK